MRVVGYRWVRACDGRMSGRGRTAVCHFRSRPGRRGRAEGVGAPERSPGAVHPLAPTLAGLRGREVGLLVRGREVEGRLLSPDPVILADGAGQAHLVPWERIQSVRY